MDLLNQLSPHRHKSIDSLVHVLAEPHHEEVVRSAGKVTAIVDWVDITKTKKIRETLYSYVGGRVDTEVVNQYDSEGAVLSTMTFQYNYTGSQVDSVDVTHT